MAQLLVALSVVAFVAGADKVDDHAGKKELDKLQGTWSSVSFIDTNGEKMPQEQLKRRTITYVGDKWILKEDDRVIVVGTQTLDPSTQPHQIDSLVTEGEGKGTTMLGIYEFKGDTFRVCFDPTGKERPKSFRPKEGQFAGVVKRQKK